jgi:hypothetical protein
VSVCKSCRAQIEWCRTENGNLMPLDVGTSLNGNIVVSRGLFGDKIATYVPPGQGDRVSHFATCSSPEQHRRSR